MIDNKSQLLPIKNNEENAHVPINIIIPNDLSRAIDLVNHADSVLVWYSCFIVLFGTIFNILNFGCFYRMKKRNSQNIYLGALTLSEILNIHVNISGPLIIRLAQYNDFNLKDYLEEATVNTFGANYSEGIYEFICVMNGYLVEVCLLIPVWIRVILAAEQCFCIIWPLKKNLFSTRKNAKRILLILIGIVCTWSTFKFKTTGVEKFSTFEAFPYFSSRNVTLPFFINISTALWAIVPEFLSLILNLLIIKQIKLTTKIHRKFYPLEHSKRITQATRLVILLSIIFIVLIAPIGILMIFDLILNDVQISDPTDLLNPDILPKIKRTLYFMFGRKITIMLYETNSIITFPIYIFTIKNFKETLKNLFSVLNISKLSRKDSAKIGNRTKYCISSKIIKTPTSKSKIRSNSDIKTRINYNVKRGIIDYSIDGIGEAKFENQTKSSIKKLNSYSTNSICSNSNANDFNSLILSQKCPYCAKIKNFYEKNKNREFNSLAEFKEKRSNCGLNCPRNGYFSYWITDNQSSVLTNSHLEPLSAWKNYKIKKLKRKNTIKSC